MYACKIAASLVNLGYRKEKKFTPNYVNQFSFFYLFYLFDNFIRFDSCNYCLHLTFFLPFYPTFNFEDLFDRTYYKAQFNTYTMITNTKIFYLKSYCQKFSLQNHIIKKNAKTVPI